MNEPVIIDEELKNVLPPLTEEEYKKLTDLCLKHGIQDSLKIWNGILIDGYNRYKISQELDLNYTVEDMTDNFRSKKEVITWIINNQGARRNLAKSQLAKAYASYEAERAKEAEAKMLSGKKDPSSNLNQGVSPIRTAAEVAEKIGVSENTYRGMQTIVKYGTQEQIDRMDKKIKIKGKTNSVSGIRNEILRDKGVVEQMGTDAQKKRLQEGGPGNKPTEIAEEMRQSWSRRGNNNNKKQRSTMKDVKGNVIQLSGKYDDVPDEDILSGFADDGQVATTTVEEIKGRIEGSFKHSLISTNGMIDEIKSGMAENKEDAVNAMIESLKKTIDEITRRINELEAIKD